MASPIKPAVMPIFVQKALYQLAVQPWQARLGLALMLLSLFAWLLITGPKSAQLVQLNALVQQQKQALLNKPAQAIPANALSEFEQFEVMLPAQSQANTMIAQLLQTAINQNLPIDKVEYNTQAVAQTTLHTLQIKLPTKGHYLQIRQLINQALNAQPSLALSEISINRNDFNDETVEAHLLFTLYLNQDLGSKHATH